MPKKQKQHTSDCIYCHQRVSSKEHLFPKWLHEYLRLNEPGPFQASMNVFSDDATRSEVGPVRTKQRPGKQLYVVCQGCNSGWMSILQTRAKPLILSLFQRSWCLQDEAAKNSLAAWVTMITMTFEFRDRENIAVPQSDRNQLKETKECPPGWLVAVGWYCGTCHLAISRILFRRINDSFDQCSLSSPIGQYTTMVFGNLIFVSASFPEGMEGVADSIASICHEHDLFPLNFNVNGLGHIPLKLHDNAAANQISKAFCDPAGRAEIRDLCVQSV